MTEWAYPRGIDRVQEECIITFRRRRRMRHLLQVG